MNTYSSQITQIENSLKLIGSLGIFSIIGYFIKNRFTNAPRLRIKVTPLFFQFADHYLFSYNIGWRFEMLFHNNSSNIAYDIEVSTYGIDGNLFNTKKHVATLEKAGNRIAANSELALEAEYSIRVNFHDDGLTESFIEKGERIFIPGLKAEPKVFYSPKSLVNLTIITKYRNEKGGKFYTKTIQDRQDEFNINTYNTFYIFNPISKYLLIRKLAALTSQTLK